MAAMLADAPVVALIGMRGAGKTTLGRDAAKMLGFDFDDLDEVITRAAGGKLPPQIVAEQGWEAFRALEADCFQKAASGSKAKIIACGGGIIETSWGMDLMSSHHPVVLIDRPIDDIVKTLEGDPSAQVHRASLGEHPRDTYKRRLPKYVQAADFRFPVAQGESDLHSLTSAFARFVSSAVGCLSPAVVSDSFFITLTAANYGEVSAGILRSAARAADVLEFRVDLLGSLDHGNIVHQVALVRRIAPGTPLLYTVRSVDHGGKFAGSEDEYFELNMLGLQLCAEFLDVECTWSTPKIAALAARKGPTKFVGSYHNFDRMLDRTELADVYKKCLLEGTAAIAKVVVKPRVREDNWAVQEAGKDSVPDTAAFIGLCLGETGKLSRVLNQVMCPSMHPGLTPGAPGQMSVKDILSIRKSLGLFGASRQFAVIRPWETSCTTECSKVSGFYRDMFSAYFRLAGLPHACIVDFASTAEEASRLAFLASTGGTLLVDVLCGHYSQEVEEATGLCLSTLAKSSTYVDCIADGDTKPAGHSVKSQAVVNKLESKAQKRTALVLGSGPSKNAILGGLRASGFEETRVCNVTGSSGAASAELWEPSEVRRCKTLDVVVSLEPEWPADLLHETFKPIFQALKPKVIDASPLSPNGAPKWMEVAKAAGCEAVCSHELGLKEAEICLKTWLGEVNESCVAKAIAAELTKLGVKPGEVILRAVGEAWT